MNDAATRRCCRRSRKRVRDAKRVATCLGFGPRFLHSTGQAYKGGPNTGVFLQITCDDPVRPPGARAEVHVRRREGGAGARRLRGARERGSGGRCGCTCAAPLERRSGRCARPSTERSETREQSHGQSGASSMQIGMIGLGRMGGNMVRRLMKGGHTCVVCDRGADVGGGLREGGRHRREDASRTWSSKLAEAARGVGDGPLGRTDRGDGADAGQAARGRRHDHRRRQLATSRTTSAARRSSAKKGIHYVDAGTSGGVWGVERGYCLMVGGPKEAVQRLEPMFRTLAPGRGDIARTPGRDGESTAEEGYLALRPVGRGPLREDDPQRHRVRPDAGLRRGLRHLQERRPRSSCPRTSATT